MKSSLVCLAWCLALGVSASKTATTNPNPSGGLPMQQPPPVSTNLGQGTTSGITMTPPNTPSSVPTQTGGGQKFSAGNPFASGQPRVQSSPSGVSPALTQTGGQRVTQQGGFGDLSATPQTLTSPPTLDTGGPLSQPDPSVKVDTPIHLGTRKPSSSSHGGSGQPMGNPFAFPQGYDPYATQPMQATGSPYATQPTFGQTPTPQMTEKDITPKREAPPIPGNRPTAKPSTTFGQGSSQGSTTEHPSYPREDPVDFHQYPTDYQPGSVKPKESNKVFTMKNGKKALQVTSAGSIVLGTASLAGKFGKKSDKK